MNVTEEIKREFKYALYCATPTTINSSLYIATKRSVNLIKRYYNHVAKFHGLDNPDDYYIKANGEIEVTRTNSKTDRFFLKNGVHQVYLRTKYTSKFLRLKI